MKILGSNIPTTEHRQQSWHSAIPLNTFKNGFCVCTGGFGVVGLGGGGG